MSQSIDEKHIELAAKAFQFNRELDRMKKLMKRHKKVLKEIDSQLQGVIRSSGEESQIFGGFDCRLEHTQKPAKISSAERRDLMEEWIAKKGMARMSDYFEFNEYVNRCALRRPPEVVTRVNIQQLNVDAPAAKKSRTEMISLVEAVD